MKPEPLTDSELDSLFTSLTAFRQYAFTQPQKDFARAIEAAVNAKWEAMLSQQEEEDFWTGVCESLDMEIACWRVSYNNGKTWTIWETDPQPSMFDTKEGMIVHPLYVPKRYAESYPPQPAQHGASRQFHEWAIAEHSKSAQQERTCSTCKHHDDAANYDKTCWECSTFYSNKWEALHDH